MMFCAVCCGYLEERDGGVFHIDGKNPWCPLAYTDMSKQWFSNIETAAGILDKVDLIR
jgi:hypothetical protein